MQWTEDKTLIERIALALDAEAAPKKLSDEELEDLAAREFPYIASVTNSKTVSIARAAFIRGYRLAHGEEI